VADPTNRNDPTYANNPDYVYVGGRWQNRNNGTGTNPNAPAASGHVGGESLGTQGGWGGLMEGLWGRLTGKPFQNPDGTPNGVVTSASIPNAQHWQDVAHAGAVRQQATNPYDTGIADQSRNAQLALIQQMRAGMDGPSLAGMQGQRAFGQNGQQALGMAAMGGANPRAAMLQSQQVGGGLAGDLGQARLAEVMRAQGSMGAASGALRGADLRSAGAQLDSGMQAQQLADQRARFYSGMGANLGVAQDRMGLENYKLNERLKQQGRKSNEDGVNDWLSIMATLMGGASTGGGGGGGSGPSHSGSGGSH
jgi:hypothetical protein